MKSDNQYLDLNRKMIEKRSKRITYRIFRNTKSCCKMIRIKLDNCAMFVPKTIFLLRSHAIFERQSVNTCMTWRKNNSLHPMQIISHLKAHTEMTYDKWCRYYVNWKQTTTANVLSSSSDACKDTKKVFHKLKPKNNSF